MSALRAKTILLLLLLSLSAGAQPASDLAADTLAAADSTEVAGSAEQFLDDDELAALQAMAGSSGGLHYQLKTKFIEGSPGFMSLVALTLILGLAFCIERIVYLTLSQTSVSRLMGQIEAKVGANDIEGALALCRNTRGPVASICYQGLLHAGEDSAAVERQMASYGSVQQSLMERGCSWISLCIAIAPSLGFLGTVIGMVMAFDQIQQMGDISPTIVAEGMKVALITTIFGIIVALILQVFYNFILNQIDHLTRQMEEAAVSLLDILMKQRTATNHV